MATPVGGQSLGNYIFEGLSTLNHTATVFGCVMAALLAVVLDQLVRLLEVAARRRSRPLATVAAAVLALVTVGSLVQPALAWADRGERVVIVGAPFTEQYVLSRAMARRLEAHSFRPDLRDGMSYGIMLEGLRHNQADCGVLYTGDVWTLLMKPRGFTTQQRDYGAVKDFLEREYGVVCLGKFGFEDAYRLAIKPKKDGWNPASSADLKQLQANLGRPLRIGGDTMFFGRDEWRDLKARYLPGVPVETAAMDQTLMYDAVAGGQLDVIVAYTSDGRVPYYGLQLLDDPHKVFPPYDAILVASPAAARRPGLQEALQPLIGSVDLETMQRANQWVDVEKRSPRKAAADLLKQLELRRQPAAGK